MALALENSAHQTVSSGSSQTKTVSLTVHASANFLVIKHMAYQGDGTSGQTNSITAMRWNGTSMTFGARSEGNNNQHEWVDIYWLYSPTTGTHNLEIDYGSQGNPYGADIVAEYWSGADSTIQDADGTYNGSSTTSIGLTLTVTSGNAMTDGIYAAIFSTLTPDSGQTQVFEGASISSGPHIGASYEVSEATPGWTFSTSGRTAYAAIVIKAAGGGGGGSAPTLTSITPNSAYANPTTDVTLTGVAIVGTDLNASSPSVDVPSGWTASNLNVSGPTAATFDLTIPAGETPGVYNITFTTVNGTSGTKAFTVTNPSGGSGGGGIFSSGIFGE